ncbi:unnamed protein product, partial [Musa banksii]
RLRASLFRPTNSSPLPRCHETSSSRRKFAVFPRFFLSKTHRFVETLVSRGSLRFLHDATQSMAAKLIANLIIMGSGILGRAVLQAYRKALENANKNGVAHEAINNIRRASRAMTEQEARQILGISENSSWEEVMQNNTKNGSFYLQSKVHRAKECLEAVYKENNQGSS